MRDWSKDRKECCVMGESLDGKFRYIRSWRRGDLAYMLQAVLNNHCYNLWPTWRQNVWETVIPRIALNIKAFDKLLPIENEQIVTPQVSVIANPKEEKEKRRWWKIFSFG